MSDRLNSKKIQWKATMKILDKLTQEARHLAKRVNNWTLTKEGVITNKIEELKQMDNETMELSTDEDEITNIMVASTEFEVEV